MWWPFRRTKGPVCVMCKSKIMTRREDEVMKLVIEGEGNKEIAYRLGITEQTVKNYVSAVLKKLCAKNRTHAARLYQEEHNGL